MHEIAKKVEFHIALIALGAALAAYGAQHDNATIFAIGFVWTLGNFIKTVARYAD